MEHPALIKYPVFRIAVAMAFGIVAADWILGWLDAVCLDTVCLVSSGNSILLGLLLALVLVFIAMLVSYFADIHRFEGIHKFAGIHRFTDILKIASIYRFTSIHRIFGVLTFLAFALLGGFRLVQERMEIDWKWSPEREVYSAEVLTPPVKKGKAFQAEVLITTGTASSDSVSSKPVSSKLVSSDSVSSKLLPSKSISTESASLDSNSTNFSTKRISLVSSDSFSSLSASSFTPVNRRILLYWIPDSTQRAVECGDCLLFAAKVSQPVSDVELTGFDYARYLYRKGISGTAMAFSGDWMLTERCGRIALRQLALRYREWLVNRLRGFQPVLGDEQLAVVAALTVGDKAVLTDSLKEMYSAAGVSHVLALSGLHIGLLSAILYLLLVPLKRIRGGERLRGMVVIILLWLFAFVTGLSPSVVRAVLMCTLYGVASCVMGERLSSLYVLTLAAFLMLCYQPMYLFDLSCQLSFLAVWAILCFYPYVVKMLKVKQRFWVWLWNGMAVSVSAQLGTLPLVLYFFGSFPTYFLLSNLIVSVQAVGVLGGAIAALVFADVPMLGSLAVGFLNGVTRVMNMSVGWVQGLEGAQVDALEVSDVQLVCGLVALVALYVYLRRRMAVAVILLLVTVDVSLVCWVVHPLKEVESSVFMGRSQVFLKQGSVVTELDSANGLYGVDSLRIGVLKDGRWRKKEMLPRIGVDFLYVCRGFKGSLDDLLRVFDCGGVVLDGSLGQFYRESLLRDCKERQIHCSELPANASFKIPL